MKKVSKSEPYRSVIVVTRLYIELFCLNYTYLFNDEKTQSKLNVFIHVFAPSISIYFKVN